MDEITEVTAQNLRELRTKRRLKQETIASVLGLEKHNISKLETGKRALSRAEKALLDLYFFGTIPFEIVNEKIMHGVLEFSEDQWKVITILATSEGKTPGKWITGRIRWILAGDEKTREIMRDIASKRTLGNANIELLDSPDEKREQAGND